MRWIPRFALSFVLLSIVLEAQVPRPALPSREQPAAIIRGHVVAADSGRGLRRAIVSAAAEGLRTRTISTDAIGRFELRLPPGAYEISVTRDGYVPIKHGQRRYGLPGQPVRLAPGELLELTFSLPRLPAITGRIVDDMGEPVGGAQVYALRPRFFNGKRRLVAVGAGTKTDPTGTFRLTGFVPGEYVLTATLPQVWNVPGEPEPVAFGPTFYPGAISLVQAQRVALQPGQELYGVEFALVPGRVGSIAGIVVDSRGRPVANETVEIEHAIPGPGVMTSYGVATGRTNRNGLFTIRNVPPGEYRLTARTTDPDGQVEAAAQAITLTGGPIDGLTLATTPGFAISGFLRGEDRRPVSSRDAVRIRTRPVDPDATPPLPKPGDDGAFTRGSMFRLSGLWGPQYVEVDGLPDGWFVKTMTYGRTELVDDVLDVRSGTSAMLDIVVTQTRTGVVGRLVDGQGAAVTNGAVLVFSTDRRLWREGSRAFRPVWVDQTGAFDVQGLPPGDYLAAPISELDDGEWADPEVLQRLEVHAQRFTLEEGEQKTMAVVIRQP
jgi:hypothetical protein